MALLHVGLTSSSEERANEFYVDLLGLKRAEPTPARPIEHACVAVENLPEFLRKCDTFKVEVIRAPKGESLITFVKDADGNLFEIKEK